MGELSGSDPVQRFPLEIATKIVMYAAAKDIRSLEISSVSTECLLELMGVSSLWKQLIMFTPALWADIVLDPYKEDVLAKLSVNIVLSRSHPLSIIVHLQPTKDRGLLQQVIEQLKHHVDRIQALHMNQETLLPVIDKYLGPFHNLAVLQFRSTFAVQSPDNATIDFINRHQSLRVIRGMTITPTVLQSNWLQYLPSVVSEVRFRDLLPLIREFNLLQHIRFRQWPLEKRAPYKQKLLPRLTWTHIETWNLNSVEDSLEPRQDFDLLITAVSDNLTTLASRIEIRLMPFFLQHLARCRRLYRVTLEIFPIIAKMDGMAFILPSSTKELAITMSIGTRWTHQWGPEVTNMLKLAFPYVEWLGLSGRTTGKLLGLLANGALPRLRSVSLNGPTRVDDPSFTLSPTIKAIEITSEQEFVYQYKSANVSRLEFNFDYASSTPSSAPLELVHWPNIAILRINGLEGAVQWQGLQFEHLEKIAIDHSPMGLTHYEGAKLIYYLAVYPDMFPVLQELTLRPYIEWDMFFIMLELRNSYRKTASFSCLESITFTSPIPAGFAQLTSKLLRGEEVHYPSKFELSWIGSMDIIQNLDT
ncbi:SubName: Full=Uncharacterized protein {ECO:0000313/EMBL:CCA75605.1} [Serendipita indica DSM 11827]|uniref:F-box domain-containing protein n=1 Tax=Serendipita indica (strain DSM 11827) TaxID=1109443 RepID=G4TWB2_SERID|nr:SubName: Full=Uncharacterized protein {ECO:0000313/EMBL:CCA75605.1} [Serendipita indica DSM 11827]CCA75605.1 hypothetical protein PIIN_09595 [Serendipita indica DSM 11827]